MIGGPNLPLKHAIWGKTSTFEQSMWPCQLSWHAQQVFQALGGVVPKPRHLEPQPTTHPKLPGVTHPLQIVKARTCPHSFAAITHLLPSAHSPILQ